jgi:AcrR family transcriptional regulator
VERADRLRKTPRQARSRSTVEAILVAAERVLRSEGYAAASTNRVARVAGFSVGSLYQYFDDKQAVVGALLDQALRAEAERIARALDGWGALEPAAACDHAVRMLLAERRSKAHLLRILDSFAPELCDEPPLRHLLRLQGAALVDPLQRFAAAQLGAAFRAGFDEGLVVAARLLNALGYALAVDAPEALDAETIARAAVAGLIGEVRAAATPSPVAAELHAAWLAGSGAAWADAAGRARRMRETRSALLRAQAVPAAALEPTVFLVASLGEVVAELRDEPAPGLDPARISGQVLRLLRAVLPGTPPPR